MLKLLWCRWWGHQWFTEERVGWRRIDGHPYVTAHKDRERRLRCRVCREAGEPWVHARVIYSRTLQLPVWALVEFANTGEAFYPWRRIS